MKKVFILLLMVLLLGCNDDSLPIDPIDEVIEDLDPATGSADELSSSMVDFGARVFLSVHADADLGESILISPLSISGALYMALNGAHGETLKEMHQTLAHSDLNIAGVNDAYDILLSGLFENNTDKTRLRVEHSVFWNPLNFSISSSFSSRMMDRYSAEVFNDKFNVEDINEWANDKTDGRIPEILQEIREDEIMFLINALYFIGDWEFPFEVMATRDLPFTLNNGEEIQVSTMQHDFNFSVHVSDLYSAVDLPFAGDKYAMSFIRPIDDVDTFLSGLNSDSFAALYR